MKTKALFIELLGKRIWNSAIKLEAFLMSPLLHRFCTCVTCPPVLSLAAFPIRTHASELFSSVFIFIWMVSKHHPLHLNC